LIESNIENLDLKQSFLELYFELLEEMLSIDYNRIGGRA